MFFFAFYFLFYWLNFTTDVQHTIGLEGVTARFWPLSDFGIGIDIFHPAKVLYVPILGLACSLMLVMGIKPRLFAFFMAVLLFLVHVKNPLLTTFITPMQIWFLLFLSVRASGKSDKVGFLAIPPRLSKYEYFGVWILLGMIYFASGVSKLRSDPWLQGWAFMGFQELPHFYSSNWMETIGKSALGFMGAYFVIFAEISYLFMIATRRLRALAWFMILFVHLSIVLTFSFYWQSVFIIIIHMLNFDYKWMLISKRIINKLMKRVLLAKKLIIQIRG